MTQSSPASRLDTRRNRIVLLAVSTTVSLLVISLTVWTLWPFRAPATVGAEFSFYDQYGRPVSGRSGALKLVLDPFTLYANWPDQQAPSFTIDAHGFRATPRRPGQPQLYVLGGSTAYGWLLPSDRATFAWMLGERVRDHDVVNASVIGFQSGQELALMVHRLDSPRTASYVVFDGWNDLFDPFVDSFPNRRPVNLLGLNPAFLLIQERLFDLYSREDAVAARRGRLAPPPHAQVTEDSYFEAIARTYIENIDRMHTFARARGARFLVVFQPELGGKPLKSEAELLVLATWDKGKRYSELRFPTRYAAMLKQAVDHCDTRGIPYLDVHGAAAFRGEPDTLFIDAAHLNEKGHRLVADLIERRLLDLR